MEGGCSQRLPRCRSGARSDRQISLPRSNAPVARQDPRLAVKSRTVKKPLRWLFNTLVVLSVLLGLDNRRGLVDRVILFRLARVLCVAIPGGSVWRIRLDGPDFWRISFFRHWPLSPPTRFTLRYVTDPTRSPFQLAAASSASIAFVGPNLDFSCNYFSFFSGPATLLPSSAGSLPWNAPLISVQARNAAPATQPSGGPSLWMLTFPYTTAIELCGILPLLKTFVVVRRIFVEKRQKKPGFCAVCGYDLRATPDRCPECGEIPRSQ